MTKINSLLTKRLKSATEKLAKMTSLATRSSNGELSSFSGVFRVKPLSENEQAKLVTILTEYRENEATNIEEDLALLTNLTSEVKAINNQAAILHGERIKQAQEILKKYQDGAFTAWLLATYSNRQTPYNFLQYYELYSSLPQILLSKLEEMPRQALYTLASRSGTLKKKEEIIKSYQGESKQELLSKIRQTFPLPQTDKRAQDLADVAIIQLKRLQKLLNEFHFEPTQKQKAVLRDLLDSIKSLTT